MNTLVSQPALDSIFEKREPEIRNAKIYLFLDFITYKEWDNQNVEGDYAKLNTMTMFEIHAYEIGYYLKNNSVLGLWTSTQEWKTIEKRKNPDDSKENSIKFAHKTTKPIIS